MTRRPSRGRSRRRLISWPPCPLEFPSCTSLGESATCRTDHLPIQRALLHDMSTTSCQVGPHAFWSAPHAHHQNVRKTVIPCQRSSSIHACIREFGTDCNSSHTVKVCPTIFACPTCMCSRVHERLGLQCKASSSSASYDVP